MATIIAESLKLLLLLLKALFVIAVVVMLPTDIVIIVALVAPTTIFVIKISLLVTLNFLHFFRLEMVALLEENVGRDPIVHAPLEKDVSKVTSALSDLLICRVCQLIYNIFASELLQIIF